MSSRRYFFREQISFPGTGSQGSKGKKVDLRNAEQLFRVIFSTFGGQKKYQKNFCPQKVEKKHPQKLLRIPQIHFFLLTALTAQKIQTEEFLFQTVAY